MNKARFYGRVIKSGGQLWVIVPRNIRVFLGGLSAGDLVNVRITADKGKKWQGNNIPIKRTGNSVGFNVPRDFHVGDIVDTRIEVVRRGR